MAIGEKYAPLGNWLKEHGGDSVKLTFDELNQIIPIPTHAYKNRPSWANLSNPASFCSSWISAGYVCSFAGDDIIELDSTTDEIKMPPFRMASFLSPLISASRFNLLAQTRKRAHHQVDVFVFKFLNDVQIGFLRSGHT